MEKSHHPETRSAAPKKRPGFWIAAGITIGLGIGFVTGQVAAGFGIGITFGVGLGILTGKRTKPR